MKRLIIKLLGFACLVLLVQCLAARFVFKGDVPESVRNFRHGIADKAQTWYFGDSTILVMGPEDHDVRPLTVMLQEFVPDQPVACIARGGFQPQIYAEFCEAMVRKKVVPKTIVIEINLRSFSTGWTMNPYYQFEFESLFLKHDSFLFQALFRPLAVFKAVNLHKISQTQYETAPVIVEGRTVGRVIDFDNPTYEVFSEDKLCRKMLFYYMATITPDHPNLQAITRIRAMFDPRQTRVVAYVTPISHETGVKCHGKQFAECVARNVEVIGAALGASGIEVLDLSRSVDAAQFLWETYPHEHIKEGGRKVVADALAARLARPLPPIAPP